jgi:hypothetical protein
MTVRFDEPAEIVRAVRARRGGETVRALAIRIAVVRRDEMLAHALQQRLPGQ